MLLTFHAIEALPESQVAHYIVPEIRGPVAHILRRSPFTRLRGTLSEMLTPSAYVVRDKGLGGPKRAVREGMIKNTTPECVFVAIDLAMRAEGSGRGVNGAVPVGFLGI